jgi:hypothetical protein
MPGHAELDVRRRAPHMLLSVEGNVDVREEEPTRSNNDPRPDDTRGWPAGYGTDVLYRSFALDG